MSRWKGMVVLAGIALAVAGIATPSQASTHRGTSMTVTSTGPLNAYDSTVTVSFDKSPSAAQASAVKSLLTRGSTAARPAAQPLSGPSGAFLDCNKFYPFTDSNGTFTFQHACGGTTGPWGFKINGGLCGVAISNVIEPGMSWTRNGVGQGRQAPHNVGCTYQFHGTFNPDFDDDFLTYSDSFTFRVDIDGATGTASISIHGSFTSLGPPIL